VPLDLYLGLLRAVEMCNSDVSQLSRHEVRLHVRLIYFILFYFIIQVVLEVQKKIQQFRPIQK